MFNNKPYYQVNREERHFGFLFASALIHNKEFRQETFGDFQRINGTNLDSNDGGFDIYLEVAALSDYWNDLYQKENGAIIYTVDSEKTKRTIISQIFTKWEIPLNILENEVFWTSKNMKTRKLWNPSHWAIPKLEEIQKDESTIDNKLVRIRWAFNAKPDILIVSGDSGVMIEVKLESKEGKTESGYDQMATQADICELIKFLIPQFSNCDITQSSLTVNGFINSSRGVIAGLRWSHIIKTLNSTTHDHGSQYILKCIQHMIDRYER